MRNQELQFLHTIETSRETNKASSSASNLATLTLTDVKPLGVRSQSIRVKQEASIILVQNPIQFK